MEESAKRCTAKDIPGFYYDEVKKRYFRITRDHPINSFNAQKDNKSIETKQQEPWSTRKQKFLPQSKILMNQEIRPVSTARLRRYLNRSKMSCFDVEKEGRCSKLEYSSTGVETVNIKQIVPNTNHDKLAIVSKIKGSMESLVQVYDVCFNDKERYLKLSSVFDVLIAQCTSVVFSPYKDEMDQLMISTIGEKNGHSNAHIFVTADYLVQLRSLKMKRGQTIWTSCFLSNTFTNKKKAFGLSNGVLLAGQNYQHQSSEFLRTSKSDVLSIECSKKNPDLYTGSRDQTVRCFDLRQLQCVSSSKAKNSVDNLKLLNDDFSLLVSTMAGQIELWDTRSWRPVLSYLGHQNSHSMLSLQIDSKEDFLASVGEDCVTRIWDIRTTELIRSIPCLDPDAAVMQAFVFSDKFANMHGTCGFIYGIADRVYFNGINVRT